MKLMSYVILILDATTRVVIMGQEVDKQYCPPNTKNLTDEICIALQYRKEIAPAEPVEVYVNFALLASPKMDDATQTITLSMYIYQIWKDRRLYANLERETSNKIPLPREMMQRVWKPELFIYNLIQFKAHTVVQPLDGSYYHKDGSIQTYITAAVTISCDMDFQNYPMDEQDCVFRVGSTNEGMDHIIFSIHTGMDWVSGSSESLQYHVRPLQQSESILQFNDLNFSLTGFHLKTCRHLGPFILEFYLPCAGMVLLSWIGFVISPDAIPGPTTLLVTLYLALTGYFGNIQAETPTSATITALAQYALVCQSFVFFTLEEFALLLLIQRMQNSFKHDAKKRMSGGKGKSERQWAESREHNQVKRHFFIADESWISFDWLRCSGIVDKISLVGSVLAFGIFNFIYVLNMIKTYEECTELN